MKKDRKRIIYCSEGINHFMMHPNGNAYHCSTDICMDIPPIFNVKNGWTPLKMPQICTHGTCIIDCDIDWTTKWIFENAQTAAKVIEPGIIKNNPLGYKEFAGQSMENPRQDIAHFV